MQINGISGYNIKNYNNINAGKQNPAFGIKPPVDMGSTVPGLRKLREGFGKLRRDLGGIVHGKKTARPKNPGVTKIAAGWDVKEYPYLNNIIINGEGMTLKEERILDPSKLIGPLLEQLSYYHTELMLIGKKIDIIIDLVIEKKPQQGILESSFNAVKKLAARLFKRPYNGFDEAAKNKPNVTFLNPHGQGRKQRTDSKPPVTGRAKVFSLDDYQTRMLEVTIVPRRQTFFEHIKALCRFEDDYYAGEKQFAHKAHDPQDILEACLHNLYSALQDFCERY